MMTVASEPMTQGLGSSARSVGTSPTKGACRPAGGDERSAGRNGADGARPK